jgi:electron transfer flavoprotein beta subunit
VDGVVRVDVDADHPAHDTVAALAPVLSAADLDAAVVVCGDHSADRGSGTFPAHLAHQLGAAQALGLIELEAGEVAGELTAVRRLDGGRRERLRIVAPAVCSVEGSVAELRRAPLAASLQLRDAEVGVRPGPLQHHVEPPRLRPWRPPARVMPAPSGDRALERIVHLTGALVDRTPPRTVELDPPAAADAILEQLRAWGYLDGAG